MKIFWPMGGTGQRFVQAGYTIPKPLLPVNGKRLVQLAMDSVAFDPGPWHYLVSLEIALHPTLAGVFPSGCWHVVMDPTPGPLQTLLTAKACLETDDDILIHDCDSFMNPQELAEAIQMFRTRNAFGGVTVRKTDDPMCSYVDIDKEWWVKSAREKDPYTSWSSTGPYWFRSGLMFLEAAEKARRAQHTSIAPVYNYLCGKTTAVPVGSFIHLGTPETYEEFLKVVPIR